MLFTILAGTLLTLGLLAVARYAKPKVATFFVSFLAVQCVLNALLDLKTVFFLSNPFAPTVPTDAVNMAAATGIPAVVWSVVWITFALGMLAITMRLYVSGKAKSKQREIDRVFDPLPAFPLPTHESHNLP
jgi:Peptidase M50B-like